MHIYGADMIGIEGRLIRFEATKDINRTGVSLLGLARRVVREGYERATKAIETLDPVWSQVLKREGYTIALNPPEVSKSSSGLDLPIAIQLLVASVLQRQDMLVGEQQRFEAALASLPKDAPQDRRKRILAGYESLIAEVRLAKQYRERLAANPTNFLLIGTLNIVTGELSAPDSGMFGLIAAARPDFHVIVPEDSEAYGAIIKRRKGDIRVSRAHDLTEVWSVVLGTSPPRAVRLGAQQVRQPPATFNAPDLREIEGCTLGKRALEIALAGGHNILFVGPPGQGKTMLSKAATRLLPLMSSDEMFEVNKIHSAAGELGANEVIVRRPYYDAQAGVTAAKMFGGGMHPKPGLVSLAHNGVLLLDEVNLFPGGLLEELRTPLSNRVHRIQRTGGTLSYPCHFTLIAAMNPCHCGWYGHFACSSCGRVAFGREQFCASHLGAEMKAKCTCTLRQVESYRARLSGPLLDRIDLKVLVTPFDARRKEMSAYASSTIQRKIERARDVQSERYARSSGRVDGLEGVRCNADVSNRSQFDEFAGGLTLGVAQYLERVYRELAIPTKRMEVKVVLVARTIADLDGVREVRQQDIREATEVMGLSNRDLHGLVR